MLFAGIESGKVECPLAHQRAGFDHCVRADMVTSGSLAGLVHAGEYEDVAQFCFWVGNSFERRLLAMLGAEVLPLFPHMRAVPVGLRQRLGIREPALEQID